MTLERQWKVRWTEMRKEVAKGSRLFMKKKREERFQQPFQT